MLEADAARARSTARGFLAFYLAQPNYRNNLAELGFTEADLVDGGSDRLVDALTAWGDEVRIRARVAQHLAAGADHVAVHVLTGDGAGLPDRAWRELAPALLDLNSTATT